jgi:RNA polymerase-binding transcription factor DksA
MMRASLLTGMEQRTAQLSQETTRLGMLTANPSEDPTGFDRAMAALHMYAAREAIEEIHDALVRIEDGSYGTCLSCGRAIPLERLEAIPQATYLPLRGADQDAAP